MTSHTCRIRRWVSTGENIFETDFEESKAVASTTGTTEKIQDAPVGKTATISQHTAETPSESSTSDESLVDLNSEPKNVDLLFGCEGDILIPSSDQIHCTFLKCRSIWRTYVTCANLLPSGCVPIGSLDPYILLQKIPPLPQDVPRKQSITGEAIWHVACPELLKSQVDSEYNEEDWDPEFVHGNKKIFPLSILKPTECRISSRSDFRLNNGRPNGIAILTSLWSYIFSVRLLELQKRQIRYSLKRLSPVLIKDVESQPRDIVIYLGCASRKLTRWLCAVLASGLGWQVTGPLPPWTTHYEENTRFIIATDTPFSFLAHERPPSSCEAADLLTELCTLFDFGSSLTDHEKSFETLQQPTAAFLAALVLPFYNKMGLQPQLPMPSMTTVHRGHATPPGYIRDYIDDLPYYMTLSIHPPSVGSIIWSIFWEPGLDCNLVSAWFGSILEVVRPIVEAGNLEVLAKIFMARRQSPALLWFGIFVLGDYEFLDKIVSYLETHDEQLGGSLSWPDVDVAAWTGSKQSFLDEDALGSYEDIFAQVPRSDLLRHRFNFRLNDFDMPRFGWQPFGHVIKHEIEPELWPRLETRCSRKYKHWIWWLPAKDKNGVRLVPEVIVPDIQRGFRRDKVKHTKSIPGQVELDSTIAEIPGGFDCKVMLGPSRDATFHIMSYGSKDAAGDRSLEAMVIPRIREHSWMLDSRGI
ncbi:hypothetical protein G7Y89_g10892 [Cudoniella acicularis]|uniref:Uncharacterized protein n=1 Tax=Cudoniella acicularis TaxID=354080 RepID=A0A8H4RCY5_9HELO|nr:hypothetical protein G7Y89_g10892 [Cudoniella acicularis]